MKKLPNKRNLISSIIATGDGKGKREGVSFSFGTRLFNRDFSPLRKGYSPPKQSGNTLAEKQGRVTTIVSRLPAEHRSLEKYDFPCTANTRRHPTTRHFSSALLERRCFSFCTESALMNTDMANMHTSHERSE